MDLRERAVAAVVIEGMIPVATRRFELDRSSVSHFVHVWLAIQALDPHQSRGWPKRLRLTEHTATLQENLLAEHDLELRLLAMGTIALPSTSARRRLVNPTENFVHATNPVKEPSITSRPEYQSQPPVVGGFVMA